MTMLCKCKRDRRKNSREDEIIWKYETSTEMQEKVRRNYFNVKKKDKGKGTKWQQSGNAKCI
jgi:hypothetical protein